MVEHNLTKLLAVRLNPGDYDNLTKIVRENGQKVPSFVRRAIGNELDRLNTYIKEKNQTWDIE